MLKHFNEVNPIASGRCRRKMANISDLTFVCAVACQSVSYSRVGYSRIGYFFHVTYLRVAPQVGVPSLRPVGVRVQLPLHIIREDHLRKKGRVRKGREGNRSE